MPFRLKEPRPGPTAPNKTKPPPQHRQRSVLEKAQHGRFLVW